MRSFFEQFGVRREPASSTVLRIDACDPLCRGGVLRTSVLASAVDVAGILRVRQEVESDPLVTLDLSVRAPLRPCPKAIEIRSESLRSGRTLSTVSVSIAADGEPWAVGETTFLRLAPRPGAEPPPPILQNAGPVTLEEPIAQAAGIELRTPSEGALALPLRNDMISPGGSLSGSLFGLLVESSAEALAEHSLGHPLFVSDLDLRFLAAGRRGPLVSHATWLGAPSTGSIRVELRDEGVDDRIVATCFVRVGKSEAGEPGPEAGEPKSEAGEPG